MHVYESRFNTQKDEPEKDVFPGFCFNCKLYKTTFRTILKIGGFIILIAS